MLGFEYQSLHQRSYFAFHTGCRFSANASGPSLASSDLSSVGDLPHGPAPPRLVVGDDAVVDAVGHPLAGLHGQRRVDGDPLGQRQRGVQLGAVGHHLVDQSPLQRVGRRHRLTGEHQLHRHLARQLLDDAEHAAGRGDETALDFGQPECRALPRDDQIAGQRQFGAAAERGAVDRGDGRLVDEVAHVPGEAPLAVVGVHTGSRRREIALRSAPAQNDLSPAPVITTTRTSGSSWACCSASPTAMLTAALMALRASGRLIVMIRTLPRRSMSAAGAGDRVGHSSSRMVALAWPPPSHMVCRPY